MRAFWNIIKHRYFKASAIVALVIMLPVFLLSTQQKQDPRSLADSSTSLSFSPTSTKAKPIKTSVNDEIPLNVIINPGGNLVSLLKLDIEYDQSILELSPENPVTINKDVFPEILEGPVYSNGRVQVVLSVGFNQTRAISTENTVLILNFIAKSSTNRSVVTFGENISAFSVGENDASGEDIIGNTSPAYLRIENINSSKGTGKDKNKGKPIR